MFFNNCSLKVTKNFRSLDFDTLRGPRGALDEVRAPEPKPSKTEPSEGSDGFDLTATPITKTDESRRRRRDLTEKLIEENIEKAGEDGVLEQGTEEKFADAEGVSTFKQKLEWWNTVALLGMAVGCVRNVNAAC